MSHDIQCEIIQDFDSVTICVDDIQFIQTNTWDDIYTFTGHFLQYCL